MNMITVRQYKLALMYNGALAYVQILFDRVCDTSDSISDSAVRSSQVPSSVVGIFDECCVEREASIFKHLIQHLPEGSAIILSLKYISEALHGFGIIR